MRCFLEYVFQRHTWLIMMMPTGFFFVYAAVFSKCCLCWFFDQMCCFLEYVAFLRGAPEKWWWCLLILCMYVCVYMTVSVLMLVCNFTMLSFKRPCWLFDQMCCLLESVAFLRGAPEKWWWCLQVLCMYVCVCCCLSYTTAYLFISVKHIGMVLYVQLGLEIVRWTKLLCNQ